MERDLSVYDMVALFMDGKTFAADELIIALGVTLTGEKVILGLLQTATENEKVTKEFLSQLLDRGFKDRRGAAGRHRWLQRTAVRGSQGVSRPGDHSKVPMAQAGISGSPIP